MNNELIDKYFPVLDCGFVALKGVLGDDATIEMAARCSYGKGTRNKSDTRNLLRFLWSHQHGTPFEMCELIWHMRMPITVHRQHIRHRTFSTNEYSARYSIAIDAVQQVGPNEWRLQSKSNKQGSSGYIEEWPEDFRFPKYMDADLVNKLRDGTFGEYLTERQLRVQAFSREVYEERVAAGVAREQARNELPLSNYTEFYWKGNLRNTFHYMGLRSDSHAQAEIQKYSNIVGGIVKHLFPLAFEAWYDYHFNSTSLSLLDRKFLSYLTKKYTFDNFQHLKQKHEESGDQYPITLLGMSKREVDAFWDKFEINERGDFDLDISSAKPFEEFQL